MAGKSNAVVLYTRDGIGEERIAGQVERLQWQSSEAQCRGAVNTTSDEPEVTGTATNVTEWP